MTAVSSSSPNVSAAGTSGSARERVALLLITCLAIAVRLFHIPQWAWSDREAVTWRAITQPMAGEHGFVNSAEGGSPLVYLALRWLLDNDLLRSASEGSLRLPFAFVGICTVPLLALLARRWIGGWAALFAALLLAIHPAHVLASQTAAPLVVAIPFYLASIAFAARRALFASAACALLAGLCLPGGWCACIGPVGVLLPAPVLRGLLWLLALASLPQWLLAVPTLDGSIVLLALFAAVSAPPLPRLVGIAAALPAALCLLDGAGAQSSAVVLTLPLLVVFAAHGTAVATAWLHAAMIGNGRWRWLGAAAPGLCVCLGLAISTFLDLTIHRGARPDWQLAAQAALRAVTAGGRLVVGAAAGAGPLRCYLRPEHFRGSNDDPHPRRVVQELALQDGEAGLRALLAAGSATRAVLVLTTGERDALAMQPAAAALLAAGFECKLVLPGPRADRDEALLVWVARTGG